MSHNDDTCTGVIEELFVFHDNQAASTSNVISLPTPLTPARKSILDDAEALLTDTIIREVAERRFLDVISELAMRVLELETEEQGGKNEYSTVI